MIDKYWCFFWRPRDY